MKSVIDLFDYFYILFINIYKSLVTNFNIVRKDTPTKFEKIGNIQRNIYINQQWLINTIPE